MKNLYIIMALLSMGVGTWVLDKILKFGKEAKVWWVAVWILSAFAFVASVVLLFSRPANAAVYGFMDGKYYDESQTLKYFCFLDRSCYDINGNLVNLASVIPDYKAPSVENLPATPIVGANPLPVKQPINFATELHYINLQPTYLQFGLIRADQVRDATYTLTINGVVINGRLVNASKYPFIIFDGTFAPNTPYNYTLVIDGEIYSGTYINTISF